ncbi:uncharacterized protein MELLADRAFT_111228 [Melampsora larici-populina 98AG31]|uniref:Uncharacterized protein n=1 Tax=Melampsora larici-populina (strain 98AG31 / pathotype 3-4-7) TaxID=747676 RepID=F4S2G3_MELLP|nr:uncharacterized protein MELLADRAFT_111228 [Melampsora larici-populina 98AG31]EGG01171.1 hypothetical protein MELLADRAFT_111228 [Melampsora larici-populina 98AG31]
MGVDEISQTATWTHCLAHCHLRRETIDFARSQLKGLEAHYQREQQSAHSQNVQPHLKGTKSCEVYGARPQQFIYPGYFTKQRHDEFRQRWNSKRMHRMRKQREKRESICENAKKTEFEVLSALKVSQLKRQKEVTERQAAYVSQVVQKDDEGMKAEFEIEIRSSQDSEEMRYWAQERKGIAPFLMVVYLMSCRLLRALLP